MEIILIVWRTILVMLRYNIQMEINLKEPLRMVKEMDRESQSLKTEIFMKEVSLKDYKKELER